MEKLKRIMDACPDIPAICIDVANGYSEHFVEFVKTVRQMFPDHIIMVRKSGVSVINPLSPSIKLQILFFRLHTFLKEVVGRSC